MDGKPQSGRHILCAVRERSRHTQRVRAGDGTAERARCHTEEIAFWVQDLTKDYHLQGETVRALRGVTFEVAASDYIAIMGPSGSGKSTLLNLLGCLDRPSSGRYVLGGQDVGTLDDDQLSGGQQQRVAIARSLVNDPYFILADEATGNLDSQTTDDILHVFQTLNDAGKTIIAITHEDEVAERARRVIRLRDGSIESDIRREAIANDSQP